MPVRHRYPRALSIPLVLVAVAALAACGATPVRPAGDGSAGPAAPTTGDGSTSPAPLEASMGTVDPAAILAARAAIDRARLADPASIDALATVRFDDGAPEAAAAALAEGVTGDARWAATWVYASAGTDPAVLKPLLTDEDASVRSLAAAAVTAWGDPAGVPVLASLAASDRPLEGSFPPETIGDFAAGTLARFVTGGPDVAPDAAPAAVAAAWTAWLGGAGASLTFNPATGTWSAS
jgi:hypothetical protein